MQKALGILSNQEGWKKENQQVSVGLEEPMFLTVPLPSLRPRDSFLVQQVVLI